MDSVLLGKTLEELQEVALAVGLKKFAGKQLALAVCQARDIVRRDDQYLVVGA